MTSVPPNVWSRSLDQPDPDPNVHNHFKPYFLEALSLLPVAFRIGSYIHTERSNGKEPIFDLNGLMLAPPHPGPHAGVPMGGLGGGAIGRGFRGEFRRWSLQPGRYHHHVVTADVLTLRVKKGYSVHTKVLSLCKPEQRSCLSSWNWDLDPSCAKFHACFPYSWTVFDDPVPNVRVTVQQTSPFLPGDYGNSSIPAACFSVTVENKSSFEDIEVSVMLSFQNGSENPDWEVNDDWSHFPFQCPTDELSHEKLIKGVCLPHRTRRTVVKTSETSTVNPALSGVQGSNTPNSASFVEDKGSYAIAGDGTDGGCISICPKFITMRSSEPDVRSAFSLCSTDESSMTDSGDESLSAQTLWRAFRDTGDICSFDDLPSFRSGALYGAAVCIRKVIPRATASMSNNVSNFNFSLAWDHPVARFGAGLGLPRYYTKFFGCSGLAAPLMATYALAHLEDWKTHINEWQKSTTEKIDSYQMRSSMSDYQKKEAEFYNSQVFNELYYLVDGGTLWTDSCSGTSNQGHLDLNKPVDELLVHYEAQIFTVHETIAQSITIKRSSVDQGSSITPDIDTHVKMNANSATQRALDSLYVEYESVNKISAKISDLNAKARDCGGDQRVVGQFLYLEGHEYLMYNTYDVHFYASFALMMLWPQLELSLQRDFASAVSVEDTFVRRMMGEGSFCARKDKNCLPHDLGSPSEEPWRCLNAYNFQDVSRWKDLGPKFILQVYRDFKYSLKRCGSQGAMEFLQAVYPAARQIMRQMESFDTDGDGMIENSGFPDQTYDIWIATGVHAYCGGLWISACEAMAAMSRLQDCASLADHYSKIADKARVVYVEKLWNGSYLSYDSSASWHHDSIMADMLAGQWFARVCDLSPTIEPKKAISCFRAIYANNVVEFGEGKLLGAVNGMRPATSTSKAQPDSSCIQSREVWTGTTYAVASAMMMEVNRGDSELSDEERIELISMAFNTARGIHDAGWKEFGYWFATPEAWFRNGNYRSMGYMRALCIWAMQFAISSQED